MVTVKNISDYINSIAPYDTKCEWDNCGILVGSSDKSVSRVGFSLDLTEEALSDAVKRGVDLIVTHHPIIFKAQKSFLEGDMAFECAKNGISVISAHTCFDCATGGVNDVLCDILGIKDAVGVPSDECVVPMARIGNVDSVASLDFAMLVSEKLKTVCRVIDGNKHIKKVAVCGGAGMDFFKNAAEMGADAYITGDISHHEMLAAKESGITVIAAGHFETEYPAVSTLKSYISEQFKDIETFLLKQSNPVVFVG